MNDMQTQIRTDQLRYQVPNAQLSLVVLQAMRTYDIL